MAKGGSAGVSFFPVVHLMTGPPNLLRNGGIWKGIKSGLQAISRPPRLMVQALHFVPYDLSLAAWQEWFPTGRPRSRLARELETTFGRRRDVFVDSGGFQLFHSSKIDLSKWGLRLIREDISRIQLLYEPQRVASLDSPIPPTAGSEVAAA